ncbi:recombination protein NinG [Pantoea agglomerans]|uniref:recombination protein NinG n=1 Tax=Enterobacter agglomerans TaxID=549 RepID=UPI00177EC58B|nr:recombination protein NinG [Pantoea agglomerans]WVL91304.1 recombination protein NinG [Pantoea agglomerans]
MAKGIKPPKPKKCRICPEKFIPRNSLQTVCSPKCAIQLANQMSERKQKRLEKEQRTAWNKRKADVKPLSHWMNMTQRAFNDYIRARDGNICISCGSTTAVSYHAGHYRTTAAASQLRFNEDNVHSQCAACNVHHSGAIGPYRINLITKIGLQRVLALESNNEPHRYTREELDAIRARYRALLRELNKQREEAA